MKKKAISAIKMLAGSYTPFLQADWGGEEREAAAGWMKGASYPGFVEKVEAELEAGLGAGWSARAVNMGRSAIQLALEALQLPPGAEVILPSYSDAGTVIAVTQLGLKPVLADVDEQYTLRYESVMEAGSKDVKALIISHLCGCWARDADKIIAWARKSGVWVIEDARQAQGLIRNGGLAGTFGDAGVFSAHGGKGIVSSGGGWVATRNPRIARYIKTKELQAEPREEVTARLESFMKSCASSSAELGKRAALASLGAGMKKAKVDGADGVADRFKVCVMSGIDARLLLYQLPKLNAGVQKRKQYAQMWRSSLSRLPLGAIRFQPDEDHIYTKMLVCFAHNEGEAESGVLMNALNAGGVETEFAYIPLHIQPQFSRIRRTSMDFTDYRWQGAFFVPVRANMTDADWKRIQNALSSARVALTGK